MQVMQRRASFHRQRTVQLQDMDLIRAQQEQERNRAAARLQARQRGAQARREAAARRNAARNHRSRHYSPSYAAGTSPAWWQDASAFDATAAGQGQQRSSTAPAGRGDFLARLEELEAQYAAHDGGTCSDGASTSRSASAWGYGVDAHGGQLKLKHAARLIIDQAVRAAARP